MYIDNVLSVFYKVSVKAVSHKMGAVMRPEHTAICEFYKSEKNCKMVIDKVIAILCEQFEVDENEITEETSLVDDLGADSMDSLDITMALEEEFDIEIPDEDAEELKTVGDIVNYIEANI